MVTFIFGKLETVNPRFGQKQLSVVYLLNGGAFKIPLMVLICGVPMHIAVGTSSAMIAATAIMGFFGHTMRGHFEPELAIPLAIAAIFAGIFGGKLAIKTNQKYLKLIFATTTFAAAMFMIINTISTK